MPLLIHHVATYIESGSTSASLCLGPTCSELARSSEADSEAQSLWSGAIQRTALLKGCCQSNLGRPLPRRARRRMGPQVSASPGFSIRLFSSRKDGVLHVWKALLSLLTGMLHVQLVSSQLLETSLLQATSGIKTTPQPCWRGGCAIGEAWHQSPQRQAHNQYDEHQQHLFAGPTDIRCVGMRRETWQVCTTVTVFLTVIVNTLQPSMQPARMFSTAHERTHAHLRCCVRGLFRSLIHSGNC